MAVGIWHGACICMKYATCNLPESLTNLKIQPYRVAILQSIPRQYEISHMHETCQKKISNENRHLSRCQLAWCLHVRCGMNFAYAGVQDENMMFVSRKTLQFSICLFYQIYQYVISVFLICVGKLYKTGIFHLT